VIRIRLVAADTCLLSTSTAVIRRTLTTLVPVASCQPAKTSTTVSVPPAVTSASAPPVVTSVWATSSSVSTFVAPVASVTAAPAALIVVVKQLQPMKPYTGQHLGNLIKSTLPVWPCVMGGRPGLRRLKIC